MLKKKITEEQLSTVNSLVKRFGKETYLQGYAFVPEQRCIMISDIGMDLDDTHRKTTSRDENQMLITEHKRVIAYFPRRKYKYVIGNLFWNDQRYQEYWREGEHGYWDCVNVFMTKSETFEQIVKLLADELERAEKSKKK